ncbi:UBX domain-containing protein 1-B [Culicoides brevitarsis]|uniref:UBX domain-containing protein 1-B n=1 Tax=Culicoides brevitarsis TaxID=469753 RepID=UPI00307BCADE
MSDALNQLVDMGFPKDRAEYALKVTNNQGMEAAMEWLLAHADEEIPKETAETPASVVADEAPKAGESSSSAPPAEAKSIKCNECNKLFRTQLEVEFHASKSGHSDFSESTEEKKPLTEEEKKEQMAKLEEKLRQKRLAREAQEKEEQIEREKLRIKSGKDLAEARRKIEEDEMKKLVAQRKREKEEERLLREKVKAQIEADRQARKLRDAKEAGQALPVQSPPPVVSPPTGPKTPAKDYTQTRIQIRMTDGSSVVESFDVKEQLAAVRLFVQMKQGPTIPFSLMTNFPKKVFADEDYEKPLDVLGLVPSAVLIVTKPQ